MEFPWEVAVVVGVPGVGKTSLCRKVSNILECNYANYGDLMLEVAQNQRLAFTDPEMFNLDMDIQHEIWETTALKIKDMSNVLVDLHGLDQSSIGYILSIPLDIISPDIIIIIEASYQNIIKRRRGDKSKQRIIEDLESVKEHMEILRTSMAVCSALIGCNFLILKNDIFDECLKKMVNLLTKDKDI